MVDRFVRRMNDDFRFRLLFLERRDPANVIHVRVRAGNGLEMKVVLFDRPNDSRGIVAGIDADRAPCLFAADDAGVLLEGGDGYFFDDHHAFCPGISNCLNSPGEIVLMASSIRGSSLTTAGTSLVGRMIAAI